MAPKLTSLALATLALIVASDLSQAVEAKRGNDALKKYCTGDYLTYCGNLAPEDPATDQCFRTNWKKLSENCRRAIDAFVGPDDDKPAKKRS